MGARFYAGRETAAPPFIEGPFVPEGRDEYYLRDEQARALLGRGPDSYRPLGADEIRALERGGNTALDWNGVRVSGLFDPGSVRNSAFAGLVRIGRLEAGTLKFNDYAQPAGIRNSRITSCDIGDDCAISDCAYLSRYIIGHRTILSCVNEMSVTNHAKFGEGVLKEGEDESARVWIEPRNEAGGRAILAFYDMICADAYLWTSRPADKKLLAAFKAMTQNAACARRGYYGTIGGGSVIKHCRVIKDVRAGSAAYIKGANKLKNLSVKSSEEEPSQIGEGVELVNGIIGYGCHVFYGCKAVRFVLGDNCRLKYGARLLNSVLGDNSTVSCCEVLNNLVFPAHEQHHNNSFLIAALLMGQSNLAAGATVGSNHNSRGNDGEIVAGRGFWPGLASAIKHNSRFASFCLIAKGAYPAELSIPFPFSLVTAGERGARREVMPAYMWMYNMYALLRNGKKYKARDTRLRPAQVYETDFLAPDTANEIIEAMRLLDAWAASNPDPARFYAPPRLLERGTQKVRVIKPVEARAAYRQMLVYYAAKTLCAWGADEAAFPARGGVAGNVLGFAAATPAHPAPEWENLGGQLVPAPKAEELRRAIRDGELADWAAVHARYAALGAEYPRDKALNALRVLRFLRGTDEPPGGTDWNALLDEALAVCDYVERQVYVTKQKDYADPFRNLTFRDAAERDAVVGPLDGNAFIAETRRELAALRETLRRSRA